MKELAKAYIQKRIEQAQNLDTNRLASTLVMPFEVETKAIEVAKQAAQKGTIGLTASLFELAETFPISQKGEILAEAYEKAAENVVSLAKPYNDPHLEAIHQKVAQRPKRIAQGLRRAAERSRDS